jgi:hypothetical protein
MLFPENKQSTLIKNSPRIQHPPECFFPPHKVPLRCHEQRKALLREGIFSASLIYAVWKRQEAGASGDGRREVLSGLKIQ